MREGFLGSFFIWKFAYEKGKSIYVSGISKKWTPFGRPIFFVASRTKRWLLLLFFHYSNQKMKGIPSEVLSVLDGLMAFVSQELPVCRQISAKKPTRNEYCTSQSESNPNFSVALHVQQQCLLLWLFQVKFDSPEWIGFFAIHESWFRNQQVFPPIFPTWSNKGRWRF